MEEIKVQETKEVTGTTVLSFNKPTPVWAIWMFVIVFGLTTTATFIIASDDAIPDALKVRIGVYLKGLDLFVGIVAKMLGVKKENIIG